MFVYPGASSHAGCCKDVIYDRGLDLVISARPLEGLGTKVGHVNSQQCLHDKTLHIRAQVSSPSWGYSVCIITHHYWEE